MVGPLYGLHFLTTNRVKRFLFEFFLGYVFVVCQAGAGKACRGLLALMIQLRSQQPLTVMASALHRHSAMLGPLGVSGVAADESGRIFRFPNRFVMDRF